MEEFFGAILTNLLKLGTGGVLAGCFFAFSLYQTWQLYREREERERDRQVWVEETKARQLAFAAVTTALQELRVLSASTLEVLRQRGGIR